MACFGAAASDSSDQGSGHGSRFHPTKECPLLGNQAWEEEDSALLGEDAM